jgi:MtN3 and saliva related transmembrane protein
MPSSIEVIGLAAGFFVAFGLVPQVLRVWRLKDAREISLAFNLMTIGGSLLWIAYGTLLNLLSVVIWNGVNLVLLLSLLFVKLKYGMDHGAPGKDPGRLASPP